MALVTIEGTGGTPPSLADAAAQLGVGAEALDQDFGVIPLDIRHALFSVRVRADALPVEFHRREPFRGPFADPEIAP